MKHFRLLLIVLIFVIVSSCPIIAYAEDTWNCKCRQRLNPGCENLIIRVIMVSGPGDPVAEKQFRYDLNKAEEVINSLGIPETHLIKHNIQYDSKTDNANNPARTGKEFYAALIEARSNARDCDITIIVAQGHASNKGVEIIRGSRNIKYNLFYGEIAMFLQSIKGHKIFINGGCNSGSFMSNLLKVRYVLIDGMYYRVDPDQEGYNQATPLNLKNTILISATPLWINVLTTQTSFVKGDDTDFVPSFFNALKKNGCDPKKAFEYESILRRGAFIKTPGLENTIKALKSLCIECR
ncbi:MAG: hypothetical protein V1870_02995 [Candidatus Aenigmatarchaeota archaeon]